MEATELWVERKNFRNAKVVSVPLVNLADGHIRVVIEKFGLTANNVSYALTGDSIGYWGYFPAEDSWGKVPVWGVAVVIESNCPAIKTDERLYGFFPMASHLDLKPGHVNDAAFVDEVEHRQALPDLYNRYTRMASEPEGLQAMEDQRCLLFPLFTTAYVLSDYLEDNDFFGAEQVIIGSVSSKTGYGLAAYLKRVSQYAGTVVGLTSEQRSDFVHELGFCDQIVSYGNENEIDPDKPGVFVDMSGNGALLRTIHTGLGDNVVQSIAVGATHWEAERVRETLPGSKPQFFFAPGQIAKRNKDWGPGVVFGRANEANAILAKDLEGQLAVERVCGAKDVNAIWTQLVDNQVQPDRCILASLS
jgi:hypothetical protein